MRRFNGNLHFLNGWFRRSYRPSEDIQCRKSVVVSTDGHNTLAFEQNCLLHVNILSVPDHTHPHFLPHNRMITQHFHNRRDIRQQPHLCGRSCLKSRIIHRHRRADLFITGSELPVSGRRSVSSSRLLGRRVWPYAFGDEFHLLSPCFRTVPQAVQRARRNVAGIKSTKLAIEAAIEHCGKASKCTVDNASRAWKDI